MINPSEMRNSIDSMNREPFRSFSIEQKLELLINLLFHLLRYLEEQSRLNHARLTELERRTHGQRNGPAPDDFSTWVQDMPVRHQFLIDRQGPF